MALKQWRFNPISYTEASAAGILFLTSFALLWSGYKDYKMWSGLHEGLVFYGSDSLESAVPQFERAHDAHPDYIFPTVALAKIKVDKEGPDMDAAETLYNEVLGLEPKHFPAALGLAVIALKRADEKPDGGHFKTASDALDRALAVDPNSPDLLIQQAQLAIRRAHVDPTPAGKEKWIKEVEKKLQEAEKIFPKIPAAVDSLVDYYIARGILANRNQKFAVAADYFKRAYQLAPHWKLPLSAMAFTQVRHLMEEPVDPNTLNDAEFTRYFAFTQQLRMKYSENTEQNADLNRAMKYLLIAIGLAYDRVDRPDKAGDHMDAVIQEFHEDPLPAIYTGLIFLKRGAAKGLTEGERVRLWSKSQSCFQSAASRNIRDPELNAYIQNSVGVMKAELQHQEFGYKEARDHFKNALASKKHWAFYRNLGVVLDKLNDTEEAVKAYEASVNLKADPLIQERIDKLKGK